MTPYDDSQSKSRSLVTAAADELAQTLVLHLQLLFTLFPR